MNHDVSNYSGVLPRTTTSQDLAGVTIATRGHRPAARALRRASATTAAIEPAEAREQLRQRYLPTPREGGASSAAPARASSARRTPLGRLVRVHRRGDARVTEQERPSKITRRLWPSCSLPLTSRISLKVISAVLLSGSGRSAGKAPSCLYLRPFRQILHHQPAHSLFLQGHHGLGFAQFERRQFPQIHGHGSGIDST